MINQHIYDISIAGGSLGPTLGCKLGPEWAPGHGCGHGQLAVTCMLTAVHVMLTAPMTAAAAAGVPQHHRGTLSGHLWFNSEAEPG